MLQFSQEILIGKKYWETIMERAKHLIFSKHRKKDFFFIEPQKHIMLAQNVCS